MILGIDHLALNVSQMSKAKLEMLNRGFVLVFDAENLPNNPNKNPLLHHYNPMHSIALYKKELCIPIELTCHGTNNYENNMQYAYCSNKIILYVASVEKEKLFWINAIGMCETETKNQLYFPSIFPQWNFTLEIREKEEIMMNNTPSLPHTHNKNTHTMLDDNGYTCLALLTRSLERDIIKFRNSGAIEFTVPFTHSVNGKQMDIVLFRTPEYAVVELIEIRSSL